MKQMNVVGTGKARRRLTVVIRNDFFVALIRLEIFLRRRVIGGAKFAKNKVLSQLE